MRTGTHKVPSAVRMRIGTHKDQSSVVCGENTNS